MAGKKSAHFFDIFIDFFAMNTFSYIVALPIEFLISGMSWNEHLQVRLVALLLNTIVARPYGLWRFFVTLKFKITEKALFFKIILRIQPHFYFFNFRFMWGIWFLEERIMMK